MLRAPSIFVRIKPLALLLVSLPATACTGNDTATLPPPPPTGFVLALQPVATGLSFPLYLTAPPGDPRLFIVEKTGRIQVIKNSQLQAQPFLDISSKVSGGSEQGLLGLAFHPRFATNGILVIDYTDLNGDTRIATYHATPTSDVADAASERVVLTVAQPYDNHNGGDVVFGPDGMLFVGMGDGGSGGDPQHHGQNPDDLLGSLLRLEILDDGTLRIPPDNPFVGQAGHRPELWNLGLRNPWRFSFDRANGDLYIADVGQSQREEIDVSPASTGTGKGVNYGWAIFEGTACFTTASACAGTDFMSPVLEYTHADGCSITGGFVYRGTAIPRLQGTYFYADYCNGWVRSLKYVNGTATVLTDWNALAPGGSITSFGEDAPGELYVMNQTGGVWRIVAVP